MHSPRVNSSPIYGAPAFEGSSTPRLYSPPRVSLTPRGGSPEMEPWRKFISPPAGQFNSSPDWKPWVPSDNKNPLAGAVGEGQPPLGQPPKPWSPSQGSLPESPRVPGIAQQTYGGLSRDSPARPYAGSSLLDARYQRQPSPTRRTETLGQINYSNYQAPAPKTPRAAVGVDVNGSGRADYYVTGVDLNRDGIPDALQHSRDSTVQVYQAGDSNALDSIMYSLPVVTPSPMTAEQEQTAGWLQAKKIESEISVLQASKDRMANDWKTEKAELLAAWERDHKKMMNQLEVSSAPLLDQAAASSSPHKSPKQGEIKTASSSSSPKKSPESPEAQCQDELQVRGSSKSPSIRSPLSPSVGSGLEKESREEDHASRRRPSVDSPAVQSRSTDAVQSDNEHASETQPPRKTAISLNSMVTMTVQEAAIRLLLLVPQGDDTAIHNAYEIIRSVRAPVLLSSYSVVGPADYTESSCEAAIIRSMQKLASTAKGWAIEPWCVAGLCALPIHSTNAAVDGLIAEAWGVPTATNMAEASVLALRGLGAKRVAVLVSGTASDAQPLVSYLQAHSVEVVSLATMGLAEDRLLSQVEPAAVINACISTASKTEDFDVLLIGSSSMCPVERGYMDKLEAATGKPVVVSQLAIVWDMLRRASVAEPVVGFGQLFSV